MFDIDIIARILETSGTLCIAWATLSVHHKVLHDHAIDKAVFRTMKREQKFAILGIILILISFVVDMWGVLV